MPSPLLQAVVDLMAESPRQLELLRAVDWASVDADAVCGLGEMLARADLAMPAWLARDLVLAGHGLAQDGQGLLDPQLRALNAMNLSAGTGADPDRYLEDLMVAEKPDEAVLTAAGTALARAGRGDLAARLALAHWPRYARPAAAVSDALAAHAAALPAVRLRIMGFSTTAVLAQDLATAFAAEGFRAEVTEAEFGQALQVLLGPPDDRADLVVVLSDLAGLFEHDWRVEAPRRRRLIEERVDGFAAALAAYAAKSPCPVLVHTGAAPAAPSVGLLDMVHATGTAFAADLVNRRLAEIAGRQGQLTLIDTARALAHLPAERWDDPKLWFYGRVPFSAEASRGIAAGFATAYRVLSGGLSKVLALDLDDTLWGGTVGEDGIERLVCDDEFPGNAFKAFQEECLRLKSQGMLLAILSKNDPDAIEVFRDHPGMVLRQDDFVATRIDWRPKFENVRGLAEELELGLDSFIFLDDSRHERAAMREMCPQVRVPELPADPASRPQWLRTLSATWPARLTEEDARRSEMYRHRNRLAALRETSVSLEEFLRNLDQRLIVDEVSERTLGRVAQMHMRTNQFNLTTRRFDESTIKAMMDDKDGHTVICGRAIDKFGDHGIVICAATRRAGEEAQIESFLMSCRVIGRGVEHAFLGALIDRLRERGARRIVGSYIPTDRNGLVRGFYGDAGFTAVAPDGDPERWEWTAACDRSAVSPNSIDVRWSAP